MTNDEYEGKSLEELEALAEERKKAKIVNELKLEDTKIQEEAEKAKLTEQKTEWEESFYKDHPEYAPKEKGDLDAPGEVKGNGDEENAMTKFYNSYYKRNEILETESQYETKLSSIKDVKFQTYENQHYVEVGMDRLFTNTSSDSGCDDEVGAWSPEDVYAKIVWNTFVCKADLFKICVKGLAINPGDGLGIQIRAFGAFGSPSEKAACECASCASMLFTTYSLTLKQVNLEAIVCDKDVWDVGSILMDSYLSAMSDSWAVWFDAQIYSELATASPGTTGTLAAQMSCTPSLSGSCCSDAGLLNLYNEIHAVVASMREGSNPYSPDYMLVSPTVASIFKRMQTPTPILGMGDISFDEDGRLKKIAGLKVIEYCGANTCSSVTDAVVAIIIDSRRAVGAVFGERPKTYKFFQSNCNSYRIDQWAYFAVGELDTKAIAHIVNPA